MKPAHHNFPEPKEGSIDYFSFLTISTKPQTYLIYETEQMQILTWEDGPSECLEFVLDKWLKD